MMLSRLPVFLSASLALSGLAAEVRTFTSPDGRTLQAEVVGATVDTVTLKLVSGQTLVAPLGRFSEADQGFIRDWHKANPASIKYLFAASYTKEKKDSVKQRSDSQTTTTDTWICRMKLLNRSGQSLENLEIDYDIHYKQLEPGSREAVLRKQSGKTVVPMLKNLEEAALPTGELKLVTNQLAGGFYWKDGARARQKDALVGMTIRVSHGGRQVFRWDSQGVQ